MRCAMHSGSQDVIDWEETMSPKSDEYLKKNHNFAIIFA